MCDWIPVIRSVKRQNGNQWKKAKRINDFGCGISGKTFLPEYVYKTNSVEHTDYFIYKVWYYE